MSSAKSVAITSWHQQTAEKRPLKRHNKLGPPDVYPQEPKQEEDNLGQDRLRKGYQVATPAYEHESLMMHARPGTNKLDRLDEAAAKTASLIAQILNKKGEMNASLDKERKKSKDTQYGQFAQQAAAKTRERALWFTDLARGKSLTTLIKKPPSFKEKTEMMEYLCDYKVPPFRALWFLKLTAALTGMSQTTKQKKSICDQFSNEYAKLFIEMLVDVLRRTRTEPDLSQCVLWTERWPYFTFLAKQAFEDGVMEKQEFLNELSEAFTDLFVRRPRQEEERIAQFRAFIIFFAQFAGQINQSLILARRTAHMVATKLSMYKEEWDEARGSHCSGADAFRSMLECSERRPVVYTLSGLLHNICIDCPAAVIWNKFKVSEERLRQHDSQYILSQLCRSPLDQLPCSILELPVPRCADTDKFMELLRMREEEIKRRSEAVEHRWSFNQKDQSQFASVVDCCLDTIGALDSVCPLQPGAVAELARTLFKFKSRDYGTQVVIRVKLMLQWAVTVQREGSHRAVIVSKVLRHHLDHQSAGSWSGSASQGKFGGMTLQAITLEYMNTEGPRPGSAHYHEEWAACMLLFIELIRHGLFSHDQFVAELIRSGEMDYQRPIMPRFAKAAGVAGAGMGGVEGVVPAEGAVKFEDLTPDEPPPTVSLVTMPGEEKEQHILLEEEGMTVEQRMLMQIPLRQIESSRSECNQRATILYGVGEARHAHTEQLKKVAKEVCKLWQRKMYVQFYADSGDVFCPRRLTGQKIQEAMGRFRSQTYYDQVVICGWCAESFVQMLRDFNSSSGLQLPTAEGLDMLLSMFTHCQYIYGIFELCEAVIPLLSQAEKVIRCLAADCIPGSVSGQLGFVFVSYLSKHWHYFLHSPLASNIINSLYGMVSRAICAHDHPLTGWTRTVAAFVYHARVQMKKSQLTDVKLAGKHPDFRQVFFHGNSSTPSHSKYNALFFKDILENRQKPLRFYSYHEYKKRLPSFDLSNNRYSFVVNALVAAKNCARDYDRLSELATFCSHITAQRPLLADEWVCAVKALCAPARANHGYQELLAEIDVTDCSTHYPLATFVMLLAGKYCYSVAKLIAELLNSVFPSVMKKEQGKMDGEAEPAVCLALLIIAQLCCQSDEPFILSEHYKGAHPTVKLLKESADEHILSMMHWNELDNVLFPLLSNICILGDTLRSRQKDLDLRLNRIVENTTYKREFLHIIVKTVQSVVCEQDWVTLKMFSIVETNRMDAFNHDRLKQNCLGQQLLRLGTRRKCERDTVQELSVCNGNSKKALIDKLLSVMNLWNLRATLFDLVLMIKEISPEGSQKHANQGAIAADALMGEIGKCCRDLFTQSHRGGEELPRAKLGASFRFSHICNYWLISPLVRLCPQPSNVPSSFPTMSVACKFLKEAASMLDTANDNSRERIQQSAWLLSQQPFLNLLLTCLKEEDQSQQKDGIVNSLFRQMLDLSQKTKEDPCLPTMHKFSLEREGLLLRLSLVGGIFKQVCHQQHADQWSLLFFQLMMYGTLSPDKDKIMFDSCYDMLSTLMLWALTDPSTSFQVPVRENEKAKYRYPTYTGIIKKLKKDLAEVRVPSELRSLQQFLPIPKNSFDLLVCEPYGAPPASPVKPSKTGAPVPPPPAQSGGGMKNGKMAVQFCEKQKVSAYDFIQSFVPDQNTKRGWNWSWFQAAKLDRLPWAQQRWVARMLYHHPPFEYHRPGMLISEDSPSKEPFLSAPQMDPTGEIQRDAPTLAGMISGPSMDKDNSMDMMNTTPQQHPMAPPNVPGQLMHSNVSTPTDVSMDGSMTPDGLNRSLGSNPTSSPRGGGARGRRKPPGQGTRTPTQPRQKKASAASAAAAAAAAAAQMQQQQAAAQAAGAQFYPGAPGGMPGWQGGQMGGPGGPVGPAPPGYGMPGPGGPHQQPLPNVSQPNHVPGMPGPGGGGPQDDGSSKAKLHSILSKKMEERKQQGQAGPAQFGQPGGHAPMPYQGAPQFQDPGFPSANALQPSTINTPPKPGMGFPGGGAQGMPPHSQPQQPQQQQRGPGQAYMTPMPGQQGQFPGGAPGMPGGGMYGGPTAPGQQGAPQRNSMGQFVSRQQQMPGQPGQPMYAGQAAPGQPGFPGPGPQQGMMSQAGPFPPQQWSQQQPPY